MRPWRVTAHIESGNQQINDIALGVQVGRGRGWLYNEGLLSGSMWAWLMVSVTANSEKFEFWRQRESEYARQNEIRTGDQIEPDNAGIIVQKPNLDTPGSGEALEVYLLKDAPRESAKIAFDVDLRCATAIRSCTELCQLSPSAWHRYVQVQKSHGWWANEPTECAASTR